MTTHINSCSVEFLTLTKYLRTSIPEMATMEPISLSLRSEKLTCPIQSGRSSWPPVSILENEIFISRENDDTGGIGVLQLDTQWLAVKEAAIPGLIGLAVVVSAFTGKPLVRVLLLSPALMNVERIQENLQQRGNTLAFETRLKFVTWMLGGSFLFSSVMNYFLATWVVTSPAGTQAFNEELGRMNMLSYPVIALPSMLLMLALFYSLARTFNELTGLKLTEVLRR